MSDRLTEIRDGIDAVDAEIQQLISRRAALAQEVAQIKQADMLDGSSQERGEALAEAVIFYRPEREAQVLREVMVRNEGPLANEEMARLFREIMSACLALEQPLSVAFLGPAGTFTQAAAQKHFGHSVRTCPMTAIDEVFREVEAGSAHFGVVPVENSTEGVINYTLDMFMRSTLTICGEVELRIHHHLIGRERQNIRKIYSHQQSLAQCREWLDAHLPDVERVAVSSNAEAVRRAAEEKGVAAIAGETAAEIYQVPILEPKIEDNPDNTTRFLVIGQQQTPPSGDDKTTLLVSTPNRSGALYRLLSPFERNGISMSRIESRPSRLANWEYVFFIDVNGHVQDEAVARALDILKADSPMFKVLGSYPKAVL